MCSDPDPDILWPVGGIKNRTCEADVQLTLARRFYWDVFMLVLLIANLIILPVTISFFNDDFSPRWVVFYVGSDAILLLDVLVNFRTGL